MNSDSSDRRLIPIRLADMGTESDPIVVGTWLIRVGDRVAAGEAVAEIVIPGISAEVTAPVDGELAGIESPTGTRVNIGAILGWIAAAE